MSKDMINHQIPYIILNALDRVFLSFCDAVAYCFRFIELLMSLIDCILKFFSTLVLINNIIIEYFITMAKTVTESIERFFEIMFSLPLFFLMKVLSFMKENWISLSTFISEFIISIKEVPKYIFLMIVLGKEHIEYFFISCNRILLHCLSTTYLQIDNFVFLILDTISAAVINFSKVISYGIFETFRYTEEFVLKFLLKTASCVVAVGYGLFSVIICLLHNVYVLIEMIGDLLHTLIMFIYNFNTTMVILLTFMSGIGAIIYYKGDLLSTIYNSSNLLGILRYKSCQVSTNVNRKEFSPEDSFQCVVCCDRRKTILLLPCKHLCLCSICKDIIIQSLLIQRKCPLCRETINNYIDVFI